MQYDENAEKYGYEGEMTPLKCDKLTAYKGDIYIPVYGSIADAEVYLKSEADKVIARYKYRHCLDMADKCVVLCQKSKDLYRWAEDENLEHYYNHKIEFFARWHDRWLELAERLKEAK